MCVAWTQSVFPCVDDIRVSQNHPDIPSFPSCFAMRGMEFLRERVALVTTAAICVCCMIVGLCACRKRWRDAYDLNASAPSSLHYLFNWLWGYWVTIHFQEIRGVLSQLSDCVSLLQHGYNKISQKYICEHKCSQLLASHTHICGILVGFTLKLCVWWCVSAAS